MAKLSIGRDGVVKLNGRPTLWFVERIEGWWGLWLCEADDPRVGEMQRAWPKLRDLRTYLMEQHPCVHS